MDLVAILKQQHRFLQDKLLAINSLYSQPTSTIGKDLHAKMLDLKQSLLAHVKLEDDQLYPALAQKLADNTLSPRVQQSLADLHDLTAAAETFLDKYVALENSSPARVTFIREFRQLLEKLTVRIKLEEETIYPLY